MTDQAITIKTIGDYYDRHSKNNFVVVFSVNNGYNFRTHPLIHLV